ncbi:MAG: hypothetical protein ACK47B_08400 [Armatimonadota bacterium]
MRIPLLCACGLSALLAVGAQAAPVVTLRSENATLHQVFRALREQTGLTFRGQDGEGNPGYREQPGARRARVDWQSRPLGLAVRDLCRLYGQTAAPLGDEGFWFHTAPMPARSETPAGGVSVGVTRLAQSEQFLVVPGREAPRVRRSLLMHLMFRAEDGNGDSLGPLRRLVLTDDQGRKHEAKELPPGRDGSFGLPDERLRIVSIPWQGAHPPRFTEVEGELTVYGDAREHRHSISLPAVAVPQPVQMGPVRLEVTHLESQLGRTRVAARLTWPKGYVVEHNGPSAVRLLVRLSEGGLERLYGPFQTVHNADGSGSLTFDHTFSYDRPAVAFELFVPARGGEERAVPFRLRNVVLPFGQPAQIRTEPLNEQPRPAPKARPLVPPELSAPNGGALLLPLPAGAPDLEPSIGLSLRRADGSWTPVRWITPEVSARAARLPGLRPGVYRVRLQLWRRGTDGTLERLPVEERSGTVTIVAGQEARLP